MENGEAKDVSYVSLVQCIQDSGGDLIVHLDHPKRTRRIICAVG